MGELKTTAANDLHYTEGKANYRLFEKTLSLKIEKYRSAKNTVF